MGDRVAYTIRPATLDDARTIVQCTNIAFQADTFFKKPEYWDRFTLSDVEQMIRCENGAFLIAVPQQPIEINEQIYGSIYLSWDHDVEGLIGHFSAVSVPPQYGRRGIGKCLVRAAEELLLESTTLPKSSCENRPDNSPASVIMCMGVINLRTDLFLFYETQGYVQGERLPNNAEIQRIILPDMDVCCIEMSKKLR